MTSKLNLAADKIVATALKENFDVEPDQLGHEHAKLVKADDMAELEQYFKDMIYDTAKETDSRDSASNTADRLSKAFARQVAKLNFNGVVGGGWIDKSGFSLDIIDRETEEQTGESIVGDSMGAKIVSSR